MYIVSQSVCLSVCLSAHSTLTSACVSVCMRASNLISSEYECQQCYAPPNNSLATYNAGGRGLGCIGSGVYELQWPWLARYTVSKDVRVMKCFIPPRESSGCPWLHSVPRCKSRMITEQSRRSWTVFQNVYVSGRHVH